MKNSWLERAITQKIIDPQKIYKLFITSDVPKKVALCTSDEKHLIDRSIKWETPALQKILKSPHSSSISRIIYNGETQVFQEIFFWEISGETTVEILRQSENLKYGGN
jgi:hypothetical protein